MSAKQLKVRRALCLRQELRSLLKVDDSFQKIVITGSDIAAYTDDKGIRRPCEIRKKIYGWTDIAADACIALFFLFLCQVNICLISCFIIRTYAYLICTIFNLLYVFICVIIRCAVISQPCSIYEVLNEMTRFIFKCFFNCCKVTFTIVFCCFFIALIVLK